MSSRGEDNDVNINNCYCISFLLFFKKESSVLNNEALRLLDFKLAKGEISEEEYLNKKRIIAGRE